VKVPTIVVNVVAIVFAKFCIFDFFVYYYYLFFPDPHRNIIKKTITAALIT